MDLADMRNMHLDQVSPSLSRLAERLAGLEVSDPALQGLVSLVQEWDGWLSADSPATSVCEVFVADAEDGDGGEARRCDPQIAGHSAERVMELSYTRRPGVYFCGAHVEWLQCRTTGLALVYLGEGRTR
jgi:hypothetical protein